MDCSPPGSCPWDSPGKSTGVKKTNKQKKSTGVGCHALLQGIFLTWALNLGLTHCRQILYHLEPPGKPVRMAILTNIGDGMNVIDKREEGMSHELPSVRGVRMCLTLLLTPRRREFASALDGSKVTSFKFFSFLATHVACRILVPNQGWNPCPEQRKCGVLNTGPPPGKSQGF